MRTAENRKRHDRSKQRYPGALTHSLRSCASAASFLLVHRFFQTPACRLRLDRCTSDLTDDEWVLVAPLIPPAKRGGEVVVREVVNGIMYVLSTSCQWRALPKDLPPRSTVWAYLDLWSSGGTLGRIHHEL